MLFKFHGGYHLITSELVNDLQYTLNREFVNMLLHQIGDSALMGSTPLCHFPLSQPRLSDVVCSNNHYSFLEILDRIIHVSPPYCSALLCHRILGIERSQTDPSSGRPRKPLLQKSRLV
ncbi:hypothetical protein QE327_gp078 [Pseudomonas phage Henu5]|uniref:Uncharacterized protein n=1 Tax=Pseudomonas phage Henu5 TaxID=2499902 RepID=A0A410T7Z1_9CAUD|nr:hypothetical protein QE327_gp078 [Pseudomonas phage Henu5]QAU05111.1 hypothetical protein Henu5_gp82 [Pseudomonas phage Henu5]